MAKPKTKSSASSASSVSMFPVDVLAIAAHRDDIEQTCGGTLLKAAERGQRTAILDLTRGEMGTRGTADDRAREAAEAARILRCSWRDALDIPDGRVENTYENRLKVARVIRQAHPRVVILPYWQGRHPDHYTASILGYEACFLAGLKKLDLSSVSGDGEAEPTAAPAAEQRNSLAHRGSGGKASKQIPSASGATQLSPHRPFKIIYASLYFDVRPTFVVDITDQFEARFASLMAYKSQYADQHEGTGLFPQHAEIRDRIETMAKFYGLLAGVKYAEPFVQKEVGLVDDVTAIPVQSL